MKSFSSALVLFFLSSVAWASEATLEAEFNRLAEMSGGTMGIAAIHLESGRSAWVNPDQSFPMASTYKVPIAAQLLHMVDNGEISLEEAADDLQARAAEPLVEESAPAPGEEGADEAEPAKPESQA